MKRVRPSILLLSLLAAACGQAPGEGDAVTASSSVTVTGSAAYRERIALPPDATVVATLEDISRADAPAETLAETSFSTQGAQVPIPFTLTVERSALDARFTYSVRVTIRDAQGELMWTTDTVNRVPGSPDGDSVDLGTLRLVRVEQAPSPQAVGSSEVTGIEWVVESIGGREVVDKARPTIQLGDDGNIAGQAPCNRYTGSYEREGTSFKTGDIAVTARACLEPIAVQEVEFLAILRSATELELNDDGRLVISTSAGESIVARRPE